MVEMIRKILLEFADDKYKDFNKSLVPGDTAVMLGVRVPKLRQIAKNIVKENGYEYIHELREYEKKREVYHEELLLHGFVIGYLKCDIEKRKELLNEFVPYIDSWAICDSSCMTYKFMKKDSEEWFSYLLNYARSNKEYDIRFAVVCMLDHFIIEEYIDYVLQVMRDISHEGYYVKMSVAWALSVCYVKFPEKTESIFNESVLDEFTHNKAIQKIGESYRVSKDDKERLKRLKRSIKKVNQL